MKAFYIGSTSEYTGKSLVCICLAKMLKEEGKKVGYFKPFGTLPVMSGSVVTDEDALFMREYLEMEESPEDICPIVLTHDLKIQAYRGKAGDVKKKIQEAYKRVSKGRDVILIGGGHTIDEGRTLGVPVSEIIMETKSKVILVERYDEYHGFDTLLAAGDRFKGNFGGVILNKVEPENIDFFRNMIVPFLEREGVKVLGIMPRDPLLLSVSVRDLAQHLGGDIITASEHQGDLIQNFVVGAMAIDAAMSRFRRVQNKAVITGGDRSDLQLAALETSTRCLILTGSMYPPLIIQAKADEMGIPIIVVKDDTLSVVEKIDSLLGRPHIKEAEKIKRGHEIFYEGVDIEKIKQFLTGNQR
ncbi:MAG: phosphotransacetylase family protein [bacterium]